MAENQNGAEKTEQPTPKRLMDARNDGQVAYSSEVSTAALMLAGFALLAFTGPWFMQSIGDSLRIACRLDQGLEWDHVGSLRACINSLLPVAGWALTMVGGLFLIGLGISVAQVGFNFSGKALIPKADRLNPITGFKRLFGLRGFMRLGLGVGKIAALSLIAWMVIASKLPTLTVIPNDLRARIAQDSGIILWLALAIAGALAVVALIDVIFQRWKHIKDLMMTRQELREEFKQSEGDPHVRGRIRRLQREIANKRMMQEVPKADVVITNPTHVAVALRYRQGRDQAPVVLAFGYDDVAQRIKAIASEHRIPLVEDVPLARALAKEAKVGKPIAVKWYQTVAQILATIMRQQTTPTEARAALSARPAAVGQRPT